MDDDMDRIAAAVVDTSRCEAPTTAVARAEIDAAAHAAMRHWPRTAVDFEVKVRVTTQGPTTVVSCDGHGTDISGGGLAVTADIDLPVGAHVGVEFTPPNSHQPIAFRCSIRNRAGNRYGLEFTTENDDDYRKTGELQAGLAVMNTKSPT